jgi:protein-disulfide isomerase
MPPETSPETSISSKKPSINIPLAIIVGAVIIAVAIFLTFGKTPNTANTTTKQATNEQPTSVPVEVARLRSDDYIRGDKNAEVLIIEYSDSDCPYCQQFHSTLEQVTENYDGKVAWVYRFYPLTSLHPNAYTEALALSCVNELGGNDTFWKYLDTVISVTLSPDAKSNEALITFASQNGINAATFKTCLQNEKSTEKIDADIAEAKKIGARGTPFSIAVNQKTGKQVIIPGAVPVEYLKQVVDSLLK